MFLTLFKQRNSSVISSKHLKLELNRDLKCSDTSFALNPATRKNGTVFALFRDRIVKRKKEPDQSEGTVGVELIINVPR